MRLTNLVLICIPITGVIGISINISPKSTAAVNIGDNLIVTSSIIKTPSESWYSFLFLVNGNACFTTFSTSTPCKHVFGDCPRFDYTCNFTHFNLLMNDISMSDDGTAVQGRLGINGGSTQIQSETTTIKVYVPLRSVHLTPNGTLTTFESQTVLFQCSASSIPKATITWKLDGATVATVPPTGDDKQQVASNYTYTANRINNGHSLSCTVDNTITSLTADVKLDIKYKPVVTINSTYNPYNIIENTTNIKLHCNVIQTNPDVDSYSWYKNGAKLTTDSSSLTISNTQVSDNGSYTCAATNDVGISDKSLPLRLTVLYGVIVQSIEKQQLHEGTLLSVNCDGQSYPAVSDNDVRWSKQNNNTFSSTGKSLSIYKINRLDSGTYICTITLTLISSTGYSVTVIGSTSVDVDVLYKPDVTINLTYNPYNVIENRTDVQLICKVKNANPAVHSYVWKQNGANLNMNVSTYNILTVKQNDHGNYTCAAINAINISDFSSPVQLNVLHGVSMNPIDKHQVTEGQNLSVYCDGQSYPPFLNENVKWSKQGNNTFSRSRKMLSINYVNRRDSGTYICTVNLALISSNGESVVVVGSTTVDVNVLYKPEVTIYSTSNPFNVIENTTNIQLVCNVTDANPNASSYVWYKDGLQLKANYPTFNISNVQRTDNGSYECAAYNSVGTSKTSNALHFVVLYGVNINSIMNQNLTEETQLSIRCTGQSNPSFSDDDVVWSKQNNNTFSRKGKYFNITKISRLDNGTFICTVTLTLTDSTGYTLTVRGSTAVEINVLYRPVVSIIPNIKVYQVKENTTNLKLKCEVLEANPHIISFSWYKDGVRLLPTTQDYTIKEVNRSNAGSYVCYGKNEVGLSDASSQLELDVLYGVSLTLNPSIIHVNESESWNITCTSSGNPVPTTTLLYIYNNSILVEKKVNKISLSTTSANCMDTGIYMCVGMNGIEDYVSKSIDVFVSCKPRTNNNLDKEDIFLRTTDEDINISTIFISFPLSNIVWSRELSDGHLAELDSSFKLFIISSYLPYKITSNLQKDQLETNEFGIYLVNASNMYGSFLKKYHFIQIRDPVLPSYVYVICKSTTAIVILKPIVNENLPQDLNIQYSLEGKDMTSIKVHMNTANQPIEYTVTGLNPGIKYNFSILAVNPFGETRSKQFECLTETFCYREDMLAVKQDNSGMFSAGIASLVIGLLFLVAAAIFILRKRFKKTYTKSSKSSKSDEYSDLQTSNPAFQDPYTSLKNPIESRHHQESSANTYEECGNTSDAAAYQNIENTKYGHKKEEKNLGIYDNMKI